MNKEMMRAADAQQVGGDEREALTADEVSFVLDVYRYPGAKLALDAEIAAWRRPEKLGLVTCVGSYKWRPTDRLDAILCAALSADGGEESPSLTNPLTPYGMLVRALRITTATTLMDMARYRNVSPSLLSGMEFGRKPVTIDDAIAASEFFSEHGVAGTLGALTVALQAAIAANQAKGE